MISSPRLRRFRVIAPGGRLSEGIIALILVAAIAFGAVAGGDATISRLAVGAAGGLLFFLISMSGRATALTLVFVWLAFIGLVRRLLIPFAGWSDQDPLLLVGPACAVMIWMSGRRNAPNNRDALAFLPFIFMVWAVAQVLNPMSESIILDAKGLLFWIPPLAWLYLGRTFNLRIHERLSRLVIYLSIPIAIHGLWHSFNHFFPFELTWVGVSGFGAAIFFEGFRIRPFSSLTSPQEYGAYLGVALAFLWGTILARHPRLVLRWILFGVLAVALVLQGTRHTLGLFMIMVVVTTILWTKNFGIRLAIVSFAVAVGGVIAMDLLPTELGDGPVAGAVEHQIRGFQSPETSTAPLHKQMILDGFERSWEHPMGVGLAHTTIAAAKVGKYGGGTEYDMSNVFVSFGVPFGILYAVFLIMTFSTAFRRFFRYRSAYTISTLGILIAVFGNIWNGGLYTVSAILWLSIGGMTRPIEELEEEMVGEEAIPEPIPLTPRLAHGT